MAIQKEMTLANGAVGAYWKIVEVTISKRSIGIVASGPRISCILSLFVDKAYSDKGMGIGMDKAFSFVVTDKEELKADLIALAYSKIKEKQDGDLVDGKDV